MSTKELTEKVTEWAVAVLPELEGSYDHTTDERYKGLPDIAVEIAEYRVTDVRVEGNKLSQIQQIQQSRTKIFDLEVILVVPPDPPDIAEDLLKDFSDRLTDSILKDNTLGGRVNWVNNNPRVNFRPPFVEFEDGTRGRIVTLYMQAGQQLEK